MKRTETPSATHRLLPWPSSLSTHCPPQAARDRAGHGASRYPGTLHRGHRRAAVEHVKIGCLDVSKRLAIDVKSDFHGKASTPVQQLEPGLRLLIIATCTCRLELHQLPEGTV